MREPHSVNDVGWVDVARPRLWGAVVVGLIVLGLLFDLSATSACLLAALAVVAAAVDTAVQNRRPYWRPTGRGAFCFDCGVDVEHDAYGWSCDSCERTRAEAPR